MNPAKKRNKPEIPVHVPAEIKAAAMKKKARKKKMSGKVKR